MSEAAAIVVVAMLLGNGFSWRRSKVDLAGGGLLQVFMRWWANIHTLDRWPAAIV